MAKKTQKPDKHVVVARSVARRWVARVAEPEYRVKVLLGTREIKNIPSLLRSFRDSRVAMQDVPAIGDLGIKEHFDSIELWSKDRENLVKLAAWFEKRGFDTTGVW